MSLETQYIKIACSFISTRIYYIYYQLLVNWVSLSFVLIFYDYMIYRTVIIYYAYDNHKILNYLLFKCHFTYCITYICNYRQIGQ